MTSMKKMRRSRPVSARLTIAKTTRSIMKKFHTFVTDRVKKSKSLKPRKLRRTQKQPDVPFASSVLPVIPPMSPIQPIGESYLEQFLTAHSSHVDPLFLPMEKLCFEVFEGKLNRISSVLYPGSGNHITPSYFFPAVTYVDSKPDLLTPYFEDAEVRDWLERRRCRGNWLPHSSWMHLDYQCQPLGTELVDMRPGWFNLLISNSEFGVGGVSTAYSKYLQKDGLLLATDRFGDARTAFSNPDFKLLAVYSSKHSWFDFSEEALIGHFQTTDAVASAEETDVVERSFKLPKEAWYYLFKKIN